MVVKTELIGFDVDEYGISIDIKRVDAYTYEFKESGIIVYVKFDLNEEISDEFLFAMADFFKDLRRDYIPGSQIYGKSYKLIRSICSI